MIATAGSEAKRNRDTLTKVNPNLSSKADVSHATKAADVHKAAPVSTDAANDWMSPPTRVEVKEAKSTEQARKSQHSVKSASVANGVLRISTPQLASSALPIPSAVQSRTALNKPLMSSTVSSLTVN